MIHDWADRVTSHLNPFILPIPSPFHRRVDAQVAAAASIGLTIKAGLHESKKAVRVQFWVGNVGADIIVPLQPPPPG